MIRNSLLIRWAAACALAMIGGAAFRVEAQEEKPSLNIDAFVAASHIERTEKLSAARKRLAESRSDRSLSKADKTLAIDAAAAEVAKLENPLIPYYARLDLETAKIGDIGLLSGEVRVWQILDAANALVKYEWGTGGTKYVRVGNKYARVGAPMDRHERIYWLSGHPTANETDGDEISLRGMFALVGNKTYEAVAGTNTVAVLEKMDIEKHADSFTRKDELRTWVEKSGQKTEAIYVRHIGSRVTIMSLDGKVSDVRLGSLSDGDREYIRNLTTAAK